MRKIIGYLFMLFSLAFATENSLYSLKFALKAENVEKCASILFHMQNPLEFMQENGGPLVHEAASRDCPDILAHFLGYKAPVDYTDSDGSTALMKAAAHEHLDCMKLLLAHGAHANFQNSKGFSALHEAVHCDKVEAVKVLLAYGANVYLQTNEGHTPYYIAQSSFEKPNLMPILNEYAKRARDINTKILHLNNLIDISLKSLVVRDLLNKVNYDYCQVAILIAAIIGDTENKINCMGYLNNRNKLNPEAAKYDAVSYIYDYCFRKSGEMNKD